MSNRSQLHMVTNSVEFDTAHVDICSRIGYLRIKYAVQDKHTQNYRYSDEQGNKPTVALAHIVQISDYKKIKRNLLIYYGIYLMNEP